MVDSWWLYYERREPRVCRHTCTYPAPGHVRSCTVLWLCQQEGHHQMEPLTLTPEPWVKIKIFLSVRLSLLQRLLHTHVYCSAIHNSQVMDTTKMSQHWQMEKKMWYLYTMEFYSAMKKNEIFLSITSKLMELENIILSEVSQAQKTKGCMCVI
jgi:hypothetical protein